MIAMACATVAYPGVTLAERVITRLEHQFPRVDVGEGRDFVGVIALGGSPHRLREAGRLAEKFPHLVVVVSGAGARTKVLPMLGAQIEPHRVLVEVDARSTHENALFSARVTHHYGGHWLLVTSASHMPRAIGAFRRQAIRFLANL